MTRQELQQEILAEFEKKWYVVAEDDEKKWFHQAINGGDPAGEIISFLLSATSRVATEALKAVEMEKAEGEPQAGFEISSKKPVTLGDIDKFTRDNYDAGWNEALSEIEAKKEIFLKR